MQKINRDMIFEQTLAIRNASKDRKMQSRVTQAFLEEGNRFGGASQHCRRNCKCVRPKMRYGKNLILWRKVS